MKLENPDWATTSPGPLPDGSVYRFMDMARAIAGQARVRQDVYEDFKSHFAPDRYSRSSTERDAEWDLHALMEAAADNGPVFIATFADACADFKRMGYKVPSHEEIARNIPFGAGFHIHDGTVVQSRWVRQGGAAPEVPPEPPRRIVNFVAMKFGDPNWLFDSPGLIPRPVLDEAKTLIERTATHATNPKDVFEAFKSRFAAVRGETSTYASSSTDWAQTDMESEMDDAAGNAPLFIAAFADGCAELRAQGVAVPSVNRINELLDKYGAGYQVHGDTIIATFERVPPRPPQLNPAPPPTRPSFTISTTPPVEAKAKALQVFLCHSRDDKAAVKELYKKLKSDGYNPWLDAVNLVPGQDWDLEIQKAVRESDVVLVCLSRSSVTRAGFMQKEIKYALDVAEQQPEGRVYIIPARLEVCDVPLRLSKFHWVDLFEEDGYVKILESLRLRAAVT